MFGLQMSKNWNDIKVCKIFCALTFNLFFLTKRNKKEVNFLS